MRDNLTLICSHCNHKFELRDAWDYRSGETETDCPNCDGPVKFTKTVVTVTILKQPELDDQR